MKDRCQFISKLLQISGRNAIGDGSIIGLYNLISHFQYFVTVNCSLRGHQFILFKATVLEKLIEETLLSTSKYIRKYFPL